MSELKAVHAFDVYEAYTKTGDDDAAQVYLKSEADKVFAEKDKAIEELRNEADVYKAKYEQEYDIAVHNEKQLSAMRIEIRRQKYKRCLDKAEWCFTKSNYHFVLARHGENGKENNRRSILYAKWHKRWLEIAEQFKEAK